MKRILLLGVALLLSVAPVLAAEIGRVPFNGRNIILNDDNTWSYATPASTPADTASGPAPLTCDGYEPTVSARIKFAACFDPAYWTATEPVGDQEFLFASADGKTAVAVITETVVIPMDQYKDAIIAGSAGAAGIEPSTVATTDEGTADYAKHSWGTFRYTMSVQDMAFAYLNYHVSDAAVGSVQLVFWTLPGDEAVSSAAAAAVLSNSAFGD